MPGFVHLSAAKRIQATLLRFAALREEVLEVIDPNSAVHQGRLAGPRLTATGPAWCGNQRLKLGKKIL